MPAASTQTGRPRGHPRSALGGEGDGKELEPDEHTACRAGKRRGGDSHGGSHKTTPVSSPRDSLVSGRGG
eukprot:8928758-Lingulodinium_polyedra.AAC.1